MNGAKPARTMRCQKRCTGHVTVRLNLASGVVAIALDRRHTLTVLAHLGTVALAIGTHTATGTMRAFFRIRHDQTSGN